GNICSSCRMSKRVRMLLWSLERILPAANNAAILHLNRTNELGKALSQFGPVLETAYIPDQPTGVIVNGILNQDMACLTFDSNTFDVAIHSETLEHMADYERALLEVHRILHPGGCQVYSIPLIHNRSTRQRIKIDSSGKPVNLLPPSFHGNEAEFAVFWEFGGDFLAKRGELISEIHYDNYWFNRTVFTVIERKPA
ncbi:MAG TPA: methyltransferase domain-containing protein, partial [Candidatus Hodarchaeales archaeon]|nr:methyltransferase domain-containing protein [Candidatus Hodarchaeales archaeon]